MAIDVPLPKLRRLWFVCLCAVAILGVHRPAAAVELPAIIQPINIPFAGGADRNADGAIRMVRAILEYTRWPTARSNLTLCIVGHAFHSSFTERMTLSGGRTVFRRQLPIGYQPSASGCDAFYLGQLDVPSLKRWTKIARGNAIVTIAENDPKCVSEAMFCIHIGAKPASFEMNIDAVSRSTVRIDPRVLWLSQGAS